MDAWEELRRKYGGGGDAAPAGGDEWAALAEKYRPANADAETPIAPKPPPRGTGNAALDTANAGATGFWQGVTRLVGLPVDTTANVLDLARAAIGSSYMAIKDKPAPDWLTVGVGQRRSVVGSSEWLLDKARSTKAGRVMVDPANPEMEGSIVQTAGMGTSAAAVPGSALQALNRALLGSSGAVAGKLTYDLTGSPALAITASMLPAGAQHYAEAGAKHAIRGGEKGRREMEQRTQDLKNAGVENPTLGLASGNPVLGGIENLLQSTPGAIGVMRRAREEAIAGLRDKTTSAADRASATRGADVAGTSIRNDLRGPLKDRIGEGYARLNDRVEQLVGPDTPVDVRAALLRAQQLSALQPGAPATSALLVQPRISSLSAALTADAAPVQPQIVNSPIVNPNGLPYQATVPGRQGGIPFQTLKEMRTKIGGEAHSNAIMGTPEQGQWKQVYGALSDDMRTAARTADQSFGPQPNNMGPAERYLNRANQFYRAGMGRVERVQPFANEQAAPEGIFTSLAQTLRENVSTLQAVKKSVTPETRGQLASTVIDRLGRAAPGGQNELSDVWSPDRFLTNWNGMTPKARREVFSGFAGADDVRAEVEAVARATSMMRDNSRMWANPSGTAAATTARALMLGAPAAGILNPWVPAAVLGGTGLNNLAARTMTGPWARNSAMRPAAPSPSLAPGTLGAIQGSGLLGLPLLPIEPEPLPPGLLGGQGQWNSR